MVHRRTNFTYSFYFPVHTFELPQETGFFLVKYT